MLLLITDRCAENCPHCMIEAVPDGSNHLKPALIPKLAKFIKAAGADILVINGCEPTAHPDFFALFERLLKLPPRIISLATNGTFLLDPEKVRRLSALQKKREFYITITSVPGLHRSHDAVRTAYDAHAHLFSQIDFTESLTVLDKLGRAKENWKALPASPHTRKAPNCFNILSAAGSVPSLRNMVRQLETPTSSGWVYGMCKPMIDWNGDVYAGESRHCVPVGSIRTDTPKAIFENLARAVPCGKCGVTVPPEYQSAFTGRRIA